MQKKQEIISTEALAEAMKSSERETGLFFKHSATCGISSRAFSESRKYPESPEAATARSYVIVVQKSRESSDELARLAGVEHESPQAIVVRNGRAVWNDSHLAIRSKRLADAVRSEADHHLTNASLHF